MCFAVESKKTVKAKKRIVCYKILVIGDDGSLNSPYYQKEWKINKEEEESKLNIEIQNNSKITTNGLYSFWKKRAARIFLKELRFWSSKKYKIFKCVIPKGAEFYTMSSWCKNPQICSNRLIVKRRLIFNLF